MLTSLNNYMSQFGRDLWVLSIGWFVGALGFAAAIPFISIYFYEVLGMTLTEIGLFFGLMAVVRSAFQAVGGEISDRISRKSMLVWAQMLRAVTFLGLGVAVQYDLGFWYVAVLWTANSIFGAAYFPALQALVSDILPHEKRLDGYAITRAAGNLGWAVGPAIGGFMAHNSYADLFYIATVILIASALIFWFAFRPPEQELRMEAFKLSDLVAIRKDTRMAAYCGLSFLLFLVVAQLIAPFSVYAVKIAGINELQLGWIYAVNGLLVGVVQIPVTRMLSRYRFTTQLALGALLYFIGYGLIGLSGNYAFMMSMIVVVTTGEIAMSPPSMTLTSRLAPDRQMGRYMGVYGFFMAGGWSLGPLYGNFILDRFSAQPEIAWLLIASLAAVASAGFVWFGRRLPDEFNRR